MPRIHRKIETTERALASLHAAIDFYNEPSESHHNISHDKLLAIKRDSMICRFKYCTDLFISAIELYLEDSGLVLLETHSPRTIIRAAVQARIFSEEEGFCCMQMITQRTLIPEAYRTEIAEEIAAKVPEFYTLMRTSIDGLSKKDTPNSIG